MINWLAKELGGDFLSQINWKDVWDQVFRLHIRRGIDVEAHIVSDLNIFLPADRKRWTPNSLGNFISAFATVTFKSQQNQNVVSWIMQPQEIVALILRGVKCDDKQISVFRSELLRQCEDVFATLKDLAPHVRVVNDEMTEELFIDSIDNGGNEVDRSLIEKVSRKIEKIPGKAINVLSMARKKVYAGSIGL